MDKSDLDVELRSDSLSGKSLDVLVTGSIAAVESVRFVRSLRRLGAEVHCHLSRGAIQFVTAEALSWASGGFPVTTSFSGQSRHLAEKDALIVAPASANTIGKIARGICDEPGVTLAASYLGAKKTVCILPSMHNSLYHSPIVSENLASLASICKVLTGRSEEGKQKFPQPDNLADQVSHILGKAREFKPQDVLVLMGSSKTFLDDIRYLSNYSSGGLGTAIAEELYRYGHNTTVVAGHCQVSPSVYSNYRPCVSNADFADACEEAISSGSVKALVCAASLLDYEFESRQVGKIKSSEQGRLEVSLKRVPKLLAQFHSWGGMKVGFKLETSLTADSARQYAIEYMQRYGLEMMVLNQLDQVSRHQHMAYVVARQDLDKGEEIGLTIGKRSVAEKVAAHVRRSLKSRSY